MKKTIVAVIISLFVIVSAYPASADLVKIADNVYSYIDVKNPSPENAFSANAGIIIGKDGVAVVDTLISSKTAARFIEDIKKITDKPIRYVINTHYHLDHAFGNSEFEKTGAAIIGHDNCRLNIRKNGDNALKEAAHYGMSEKDLEGTRVAWPSVSFRDKMTIDLGDEIIELIYFAPSHSPDSILVFLPEKRLLFSGDVLFTDFHPFMGEGDLDGWLRILDYILYLDVDKIIPGHGPLSTKNDVKDMKEYLILFDKNAKELASKSKDAKQIEAELLKILPKRSRGEFLISSNIKMKYLKE